MRNYDNFDRYITSLYSDVYPQPEDPGHTGLARKVIDHWMSKMTTCHSVLDCGCGTGFCQEMFERWGIGYYGIALGEDVVVAQEKGRNVSKMDFSFIDSADNSFDMIFARHALEHSPFPLLTLMEWNRVARNWLGIVVPAPEWYTYKGLNHYSVMNQEQIEVLLDRAGWHIIWKEIDSIQFDPDKPDTKPHEYWYMCEKKRGN
jgi:SAM-dependent methyltransferase